MFLISFDPKVYEDMVKNVDEVTKSNITKKINIANRASVKNNLM